MGLIDIDDRDVHNYYQTSIHAIEIQKQWLMELKSNNPTSTVISLGESVYQINLPVITCIGSDVETRFNIPYMHRMIRMEIKHTNNSDVDSSESLRYSVSKRQHYNLWMLVLDIADSVASDIIDKYDEYYMGRGEYLIVSNSTNTDKLLINVLIKITGV